MSELARETLEQIAGYIHDDRDDIEFVRITTVARELLTLRAQVEHQARPLQEACTCGIRSDAPAGPNHGPGCPMEVTEATIAILRGMLADAKERAETAERERDEWKTARDTNYADAMRFHDERDVMERERDEEKAKRQRQGLTISRLQAERDDRKRERDAARAEADESRSAFTDLQAETAAILEAQYLLCAGWRTSSQDADRDRRSAEAERDAARAALAKYGRHLPYCLAWPERDPREPCTCGLADALNASPS